MKKVFGAFSARFMRSDGADAVTLAVSKPVVTVQTNSGGYPITAAAQQDIPVVMYYGDKVVSDAIVMTINGISTVQTNVNGFRIERNGNALRYTYVTTRIVENLSCQVVVRSATLNVSKECTISFVIAKQGAQGIQGIQGKMLRRRGDFTGTLSTTTETIYNNEAWCDWIVYGNGTETGKFKYRLADSIKSWTKSGVVKQDGTTVSGTFLPAGGGQSNSYWVVFSELKDAAFNFIIANGLDASQASLCEAFIGTSGATLNPDGTISVSDEANGWVILGGLIRHTRTGLTLTADGYIADPNGLHIKVGNSSKQGENLLPDAYFDSIEGIAITGGSGATITALAFNSFTFFGKQSLRIYQPSNSTARTIVTNDILLATAKRRWVLKPSTTYTFTFFGATGNGALPVNKSILLLYNAATGGSATQVALPAFDKKYTYERHTVTFTTDTTHLYFDFRLGMTTVANAANAIVIDAVKLEQGPEATAMSEGIKAGLLATGIDIEDKKITMTADKFECQNNSGVKTAWLDDMGNFTVRGVYNNLITVIDSTNWDKYIIKIGSGSSAKFYLDVLRCGTFVMINYLPVSDFNAASDGMLHLPYYANDNYFTRGYTRYLDKSDATPRMMTADELRMLAGRKMVIKWNAFTGISNNRSLGYVFRPEVHYGSTTITTDRLDNRLRDLYAGERHCISINSSNISTVNRSPVLYVSQTFFMSFSLVKFHANQSSPDYSWGYIWMADKDAGSAAQDDINWD